MATTLSTFPVPSPVTAISRRDTTLQAARDFFNQQFDNDFTFWDGKNGEIALKGERCFGELLTIGAMVQAVAERGQAEYVDECDGAVLLAIPLLISAHESVIAVAPFATKPYSVQHVADVARLLNVNPDRARDWWQHQQPWDPEHLLRWAALACRTWNAEQQARRLRFELEDVTATLARTFEEISLLYSITQRLRISATDVELGQLALQWLQEYLEAESLLAQYLPVARPDEITYKARTEPVLMSVGPALLDNQSFSELVAHLQLTANSGPCVLNRNVTSQASWPFPHVRELVVVPMVEGRRLYGWLAALNRIDGREFGTVEAKLMVSVAAILGIHSGNRELYRQQAELLASVVRALVSAIDAKDPYTCGHSDRVARICVRLAREMGCSSEALHTVYMAGLLHDIGKIGIDDQVLRKPGALTPEEYEHIKQHPVLGYRILADIRQMADALPIVLHHHEQWNGKGYPAGLNAEQIPLLARIAALADAFDAMTSDRPYRKGMPVEKVEEIFRKGAGEQWDPRVIEAYFRCRDEILAIVRQERANLSLDVDSWFKDDSGNGSSRQIRSANGEELNTAHGGTFGDGKSQGQRPK